jgi:threonine dehydrogenase-like Zn-dependent dehydrogenase
MLRKMKAAALVAPRTFRIERASLPEPGPGQVRIRLDGCGVCGSNLTAWEGRPWFKYPLAPGELGHEGWGRIDAVGPGSERRLGERVVVLSYRAYAEFDIAPSEAALPVPDSVPQEMPLPGEALGCAMNIIKRSDLRSGQTVAIVGIGFLGALLTDLAVRAGANVIALSRRPDAIQRARSLGAVHANLLSAGPSAVDEVRHLTAGQGCERVIEAAGAQESLDVASAITAERGRLVIAGYHQEGPREVNMQSWNWRGIDVINAHERSPSIYLDGMRAALREIADHGWDPSPLFTHAFALDEIGQAFDLMRHRPEGFLKGWIRTTTP